MNSDMEKIIDPVSKDLLLAELTEDRLLRKTNRGDNEIYVVDWRNAPNTLKEIGRLREISYREAGGCSGLSCDIDEYDTMEIPYQQLIVWDPEAKAIIGGYRYILGTDIRLDSEGVPILSTSHLFRFSKLFIEQYLPHTIELGRAFVSPDYQSSKAGAKAIFALDNLWDGLSTLMINHPNQFYYFGKMTMYSSYDQDAKDIILNFLWKHFEDTDELIRPIVPIMPKMPRRVADLILKYDDFKKDYVCLKEAVHSLGTAIPPLFNSYMSISPTMKMFGTAFNGEFGQVEETGILIDFDDLYPEKSDRHILSYIKQKMSSIEARFPNLEEGFQEKIVARWKRRRQSAKNKWLKLSSKIKNIDVQKHNI